MRKSYFYHDDGKMYFYKVGGSVEVGDVYQEVDGYYVIAFARGGCWEGHHLIEIGKVLEEMNLPWDTEIKEYFNASKHESRN